MLLVEMTGQYKIWTNSSLPGAQCASGIWIDKDIVISTLIFMLSYWHTCFIVEPEKAALFQGQKVFQVLGVKLSQQHLLLLIIITLTISITISITMSITISVATISITTIIITTWSHGFFSFFAQFPILSQIFHCCTQKPSNTQTSSEETFIFSESSFLFYLFFIQNSNLWLTEVCQKNQ